jgi:drug/metabolite transporter (DMT)-like permease
LKPAGERAAVTGALLLVQILFGLHYLAAKIVVGTIPPRTWAVLRVTAAALVLLLIVAALRRSLRFSRADLGRLAIYSVFGIVINQICFIEGLHRTTPTHSSIINTTIPIGTLLFAVLLRRESLDLWKSLSLAVSLAGVLLVVHPHQAGFSSETLAGDLLTLANAMSYALFLVISKRLLARSDPLAATTVLMGFGALGILAIGAPGLAAFRPSAIPASIWVLAALIVVFATVVTYFLNYWALARVESSLVALFIYVQPVIATVLSAIVLAERPEPHVLAGGALVFAGVWLSLRKRTPAPLPVESAEG